MFVVPRPHSQAIKRRVQVSPDPYGGVLMRTVKQIFNEKCKTSEEKGELKGEPSKRASGGELLACENRIIRLLIK